jgi:hypothetical protein
VSCLDADRRPLSNRYQIGGVLFEVIQAVLRTEIAGKIAREELRAVNQTTALHARNSKIAPLPSKQMVNAIELPGISRIRGFSRQARHVDAAYSVKPVVNIRIAEKPTTRFRRRGRCRETSPHRAMQNGFPNFARASKARLRITTLTGPTTANFRRRDGLERGIAQPWSGETCKPQIRLASIF